MFKKYLKTHFGLSVTLLYREMISKLHNIFDKELVTLKKFSHMVSLLIVFKQQRIYVKNNFLFLLKFFSCKLSTFNNYFFIFYILF
jgi:hypothetical protein